MTGEAKTSARPSAADDSPRQTETASTTSTHDSYDPQQIIAMARHPPPGASVYSPTAVPSAALNPRSCVTCRRRKVRCDKHMPCSNCRRAQIPCIFPAPGRAPRRPRPKDPNAPAKQPSSERELELMKRLRKLEGIVEELSGQIEIESARQPYSATSSPEAVTAYSKDEQAIGGRFGRLVTATSSSNHGSSGVASAKLPPRQDSGAMSESDSLGKGSPDVHKQFGRLVLNEKGVTRYVSSSLWSSITDELDELRKASQDLSDDESAVSEDHASPESADHDKGFMDHQSFIFGYRSADVDLKSLHPLPSQIPFIWQVYQENVDPILKVVHVPTMSKVIKEFRQNLDSLSPSMEALMFSIYYATISSLEEEDVKLNFGTERSVLIQKYRFAVEQALAKAEFLTKPDFAVVQALMLFLVLVRRHDDTRFAWTLTSLLIRLSQALGLHRDGSHFPNLTPFQIEMRRRLFWAVCVLDLRSAEDQGTDLSILSDTFDTQLPLNINDADISPESTQLPEPREGTTDMTFSLIRYEICSLSRRLHRVSSDMAPACRGDAKKSLAEREALLNEVANKVQKKLLKGGSNTMFWVASNVTRIVLAKMTLVIYQPLLFPGSGDESLSEDVRTRLLNAALDVFEYSHILNTDPRCKQWRWLFQTWMHWNALAYSLIEVSHRPWGPKAERLWAALNLNFRSPNPAELEKLASHHAVWMPLRKLYLKVKKHRELEIARLQADPQAAQELAIRDEPGTPPSTFGAIPGSVKGAMALDRWRKLVNLPPPPPEQSQSHEEPTPGPPARSQTAPQGTMGAHAADTAGYAKPEVMEYLDGAMADPAFIPIDFAPLWNTAQPDEVVRGAFNTPYQPGNFTQNSGSLGFDTNTPMPDLRQIGRTPTSMSLPAHLSQPQQQQTSQGMVQTPLNNEDTLPPWLWPTTGSPDILNLPNTENDDVDMNMDDGFDWQTWQENLGRYEVEANGGRTGSTWVPGL
ncbi:fungal-specific transcription factor domain-containing protein [Thermothelomyces heterothallicus CBS 202.75]|uniref:fungal-specific transcription factor domain-containing protein n=1 Tax=Thermothelomyces heterothallicus CBS 202.75 TaxID=1149848 RepID=UPI003742CF66